MRGAAAPPKRATVIIHISQDDRNDLAIKCGPAGTVRKP